MSSVSLPVENAVYQDCIEDQLSGINAVVQIIPISAIDTFPEIGTVSGQPNIFVISEMEKLVSAGGDIVLKPNESSIFLPCKFEMSEFDITSVKGAWNTKLTVQLQNTTHNRGVLSQLKKIRFVAIVQDLATGDKIVIGRKVLENIQEGAFLSKTEPKATFGKEYDSERDLTLQILCKKNMPLTHYGRIKASWEFEVDEDPISTGGSLLKINTLSQPITFDIFKAYEAGKVFELNNNGEITYVFQQLEFESVTINTSGFEPTPNLTNPASVQLFLNTNKELWTNSNSSNGNTVVNGDSLRINYYDEF